MTVTKSDILKVLSELPVEGGVNLVSDDLIRALQVSEDGRVSFVIEFGPNQANTLPVDALKQRITTALLSLSGVSSVNVSVSAADKKAPPSLKIGGHPKPQSEPLKVEGVARILAIGSGKGGVGKSTVSSNLAVALAKQGRRVGLLDADIYGPSQPRMMGVSKRPSSPDGKRIIPLKAHGVTIMSIGLMLPEDKAIVWRGPMLMGALQQMLSQVEWGELDVLLIDLPPGTGDVQLTLCQKADVTGTIVVSTPQDVALIDARKAIDMFNSLNTPVLGLIENMSLFHCPKCGHESHIFGHGGVQREAEALGVPLLAALPIDLETRLAGDNGAPVALGDCHMAKAYAQLAQGLVDGNMA